MAGCAKIGRGKGNDRRFLHEVRRIVEGVGQSVGQGVGHSVQL